MKTILKLDNNSETIVGTILNAENNNEKNHNYHQ